MHVGITLLSKKIVANGAKFENGVNNFQPLSSSYISHSRKYLQSLNLVV